MGALSVLWAEMHSVSAFKWPKPMVWRHADCPYYVQEKHCACLVPAIIPCKMLQQVLVHSLMCHWGGLARERVSNVSV